MYNVDTPPPGRQDMWLLPGRRNLDLDRGRSGQQGGAGARRRRKAIALR